MGHKALSRLAVFPALGTLVPSMIRIRRPRLAFGAAEHSSQKTQPVASDRAAPVPIYPPVPSTWPTPPSISNRDRQDSRQRSDAAGQPHSLSREPAQTRWSPARFAQELPRPQAALRYIPSPDSGAIRESSHLESQATPDLQEHFNAYAISRGWGGVRRVGGLMLDRAGSLDRRSQNVHAEAAITINVGCHGCWSLGKASGTIAEPPLTLASPFAAQGGFQTKGRGGFSSNGSQTSRNPHQT
jgi:hypothetical protein